MENNGEKQEINKSNKASEEKVIEKQEIKEESKTNIDIPQNYNSNKEKTCSMNCWICGKIGTKKDDDTPPTAWCDICLEKFQSKFPSHFKIQNITSEEYQQHKEKINKNRDIKRIKIQDLKPKSPERQDQLLDKKGEKRKTIEIEEIQYWEVTPSE
jgi:hypothetical protein